MLRHRWHSLTLPRRRLTDFDLGLPPRAPAPGLTARPANRPPPMDSGRWWLPLPRPVKRRRGSCPGCGTRWPSCWRCTRSPRKMFYPQLLRKGVDGQDETLDAIGDHNEMRDGVHDAAKQTNGQPGLAGRGRQGARRRRRTDGRGGTRQDCSWSISRGRLNHWSNLADTEPATHLGATHGAVAIPKPAGAASSAGRLARLPGCAVKP
jgi:hypothetical protein